MERCTMSICAFFSSPIDEISIGDDDDSLNLICFAYLCLRLQEVSPSSMWQEIFKVATTMPWNDCSAPTRTSATTLSKRLTFTSKCRAIQTSSNSSQRRSSTARRTADEQSICWWRSCAKADPCTTAWTSRWSHRRSSRSSTRRRRPSRTSTRRTSTIVILKLKTFSSGPTGFWSCATSDRRRWRCTHRTSHGRRSSAIISKSFYRNSQLRCTGRRSSWTHGTTSPSAWRRTCGRWDAFCSVCATRNIRLRTQQSFESSTATSPFPATPGSSATTTSSKDVSWWTRTAASTSQPSSNGSAPSQKRKTGRSKAR